MINVFSKNKNTLIIEHILVLEVCDNLDSYGLFKLKKKKSVAFIQR